MRDNSNDVQKKKETRPLGKLNLEGQTEEKHRDRGNKERGTHTVTRALLPLEA